MAIIKEVSDSMPKSIIFWQEWAEYSSGEPAILIAKYSDSLEITQGEHNILISDHEISAFLKAIKSLK